MIIQIDTAQIEEVIPFLRAAGYAVERRRFSRGLPPPFGDGVEITNEVRFDERGEPVFPERS